MFSVTLHLETAGSSSEKEWTSTCHGLITWSHLFSELWKWWEARWLLLYLRTLFISVQRNFCPSWVLRDSHGPRTDRCGFLILCVISYQLIMSEPVQKTKLLTSTRSPAFHFLPVRKWLRTSWCPPCSSWTVGVRTFST